MRIIMEGGAAWREAERRAKRAGKPIHLFKHDGIYRFSVKRGRFDTKDWIAEIEPDKKEEKA